VALEAPLFHGDCGLVGTIRCSGSERFEFRVILVEGIHATCRLDRWWRGVHGSSVGQKAPDFRITRYVCGVGAGRGFAPRGCQNIFVATSVSCHFKLKSPLLAHTPREKWGTHLHPSLTEVRGLTLCQKSCGPEVPGRLTGEAPVTTWFLLMADSFYVPSLQPARYSSCSGVRRSILIPMDSSFSLATRLSSSSGTL
jgi:hypothetical protein